MITSTPSGPTWRKSRHSGDGQDCVEIARDGRGAFLVRDSKAPGAGVLRFGTAEWRSFLDAAKKGRV
ncbi:DUF397 domain-containing protein [Actinomadura sp. NEAU-AAG7]|uniref:DUF397 domain-containing protein n=1 Tax=Actinomadura sp. NEAU-AAG7 TaxID=2839640 RepID=UPI002032D710|nr:DUF397 domain-containing protein [Actinomadura sp. NEAU-AAG7]